MEELAEYEIEPAKPLSFRVENDEQAAWAMRQFATACKKIEENEAILAKERLRWQAWIDEVNQPLARNAAYFEDLLKDYLRRERDNRKSIKLPHGVIKSRASTRVEVGEEFIEWAQKNNRDDLLTFPAPKPNIAAIKESKDVEFVEVVESVSFSVEIKE